MTLYQTPFLLKTSRDSFFQPCTPYIFEMSQNALSNENSQKTFFKFVFLIYLQLVGGRQRLSISNDGV